VDERGDGRFRGFEGGFVAEVAESLTGDGADGGEDDFRGEFKVGGFEEVSEIANGRGRGEGDGVGVVRG
jgi:hypothetical protein